MSEQWTVLEPRVGELLRRVGGRGRTWRDCSEVLNGMLWILRTGAQWADLLERYPPYQTCHRRFQRWSSNGTLVEVLEVLAADLKERGGLDLSECFIDGTFVVAKIGGECVGATKRGKGSNLMGVAGQWQIALGFLSPSVSAGPPRLRLAR
jgi:transposase